MASYRIGSGVVVVDTITKEFPWATVDISWSSNLLVVENLVHFAMNYESSPPVVVVSANVLALEAESAAGTVYEFEVTSTVTVTCEPVSGSVFELGLTTVTCSASNSAGGSIESFNVTIVDTQGPVISGPTTLISQQGNTAGGATVTYNVSANDAVDGVTAVACDKPSDSFLFPVGNSTVTCTSSDSGDRETTATFTVEVIDTVGPDMCMTTTAPHTQEGNTAGGAVFTYTVTAEDIVEGTIATVICSHASGSVFPVGTTIISCSSKDSGDHETVATIDVVVTDTTGPVITVPVAAVTQEASAASGATVTYSVTANDVVEGTKTVTCDKLSGTFMFPLGNNTVTCTATDSGDFETNAFFCE
jgi:hypothetical protein